MGSTFRFSYSLKPMISQPIPAPSMITQRDTHLLGFEGNTCFVTHSKLRYNRNYHIYNRIPRATDRSLGGHHDHEANEKGEDRLKSKPAVRASSMVLACAALSIIGCSSKMMKHMAMAGPKQLYQKAPPAMYSSVLFPIGGKAALKSLLDVSASLASDEIGFSKGFNLDQLPSRPSKEDVDAIKMEAVRLVKMGKPEDGLQLLYRACNKFKNDSEPAYNVEMALVEILICQGKYKEASECRCLQDDQGPSSDVRLYLCKAILYTMLDRDEEAKKWWKEFRKTIGEGINPTDFE